MFYNSNDLEYFKFFLILYKIHISQSNNFLTDTFLEFCWIYFQYCGDYNLFDDQTLSCVYTGPEEEKPHF